MQICDSPTLFILWTTLARPTTKWAKRPKVGTIDAPLLHEEDCRADFSAMEKKIAKDGRTRKLSFGGLGWFMAALARSFALFRCPSKTKLSWV